MTASLFAQALDYVFASGVCSHSAAADLVSVSLFEFSFKFVCLCWVCVDSEFVSICRCPENRIYDGVYVCVCDPKCPFITEFVRQTLKLMLRC